MTTILRSQPPVLDNNKHETRDPVIPLPVPDRLARGQPFPKRLAAPLSKSFKRVLGLDPRMGRFA
jgi:hypothetical protein